MKPKINFKIYISNLLIALALLMVSCGSKSQKQPAGLKAFKIIIENNDKELKISCEKGCAWEELTFNANEDKPQAIDEYGMTEPSNV